MLKLLQVYSCGQSERWWWWASKLRGATVMIWQKLIVPIECMINVSPALTSLMTTETQQKQQRRTVENSVRWKPQEGGSSFLSRDLTLLFVAVESFSALWQNTRHPMPPHTHPRSHLALSFFIHLHSCLSKCKIRHLLRRNSISRSLMLPWRSSISIGNFLYVIIKVKCEEPRKKSSRLSKRNIHLVEREILTWISQFRFIRFPFHISSKSHWTSIPHARGLFSNFYLLSLDDDDFEA